MVRTRFFFFVLVQLLYFQYILVECKECITTQDSIGDQKDLPCVFPFVIGDKTFNECTTDTDPDGRLWCATETDDSNNQIGGKWGYCPDNCGKRKSTCRTTNEPGSNAKNASCQFPFTIGDHTFDACTTEKDPEGRLWCSTKVDRFGIHTEGNWGYCSDDCFFASTEIVPKNDITCATTDEFHSKVKNASCLFPWTFMDQTYDSCTTDTDPDGRFWCATKLDESGVFVDGNWGYCSDDCFQDEPSSSSMIPIMTTSTTTTTATTFTTTTTTASTSTSSGFDELKECIVTDQETNSEKACSFPFIINDKIYYGCTTDFAETQNLACSTKTNTEDEHIEGNWGECDSNLYNNSNTCINNDEFSEEENKDALEINDLINQYEVNDQINIEIITRSFNSRTSCQCVNVMQCVKTKELTEQKNRLSRWHYQRRKIDSYIRSLACNGGVRCCGETVGRTRTTTRRTTTRRTPTRRPTTRRPSTNTRTRPSTTNSRRTSNSNRINEKDRGTWKPQASKKECGTSLFDISIVGGRNTLFGEYPFMALLGYRQFRTSGRSYDYECGGAVINKYYILTAAHCMLTKDPVVVVVGEHNLTKDPDQLRVAKKKTIGIEKIIVHEDYSKTLYRGAGPNDIALIRVKTPIPLYQNRNKALSNVIPICLPWNINDPGRNIYNGVRLKVLGWGRTSNDRYAFNQEVKRIGAGSDVLQQVDIPNITNRKCKTYSAFNVIQLDSKKQMCAGGENGKDSCGGDSGGPLIQRARFGKPWFQVGVVSFGTRTCGSGTPAVYTRIANYIPWIEKNLKP